MKPQWEVIIPEKNFEETARLWVPLGWLVKVIDKAKNPISIAMSYVPDPDHLWDIK